MNDKKKELIEKMANPKNTSRTVSYNLLLWSKTTE
jgi:hypothetical protein